MLVIDTAAPTDSAPALKQRSTMSELRTTASGVPDLTRHSRRDVGRHRVYCLAPLGHDAVDPHGILLAEDFPVGVDGLQCECRSVQRVDTPVRRTPSVCAQADEPNIFHDVSVAGATGRERMGAHVAGGVAHHGDINVVELAQFYQLLLAAQKLDLPGLAQIQPVGNLDKLLCRYGEGHYLTVQFGAARPDLTGRSLRPASCRSDNGGRTRGRRWFRHPRKGAR